MKAHTAKRYAMKSCTDAELVSHFPEHNWWAPIPVRELTVKGEVRGEPWRAELTWTRQYCCPFCLYREGRRRVLYPTPERVEAHLKERHLGLTPGTTLVFAGAGGAEE